MPRHDVHPAYSRKPATALARIAGMRELLHTLWATVAGIPHLAQILTVTYVAYLMLLACYIVLQKREPVATLSWILSLAALPYLGLFVFYLFGPQRIVRQRLRRGVCCHDECGVDIFEQIKQYGSQGDQVQAPPGRGFVQRPPQ